MSQQTAFTQTLCVNGQVRNCLSKTLLELLGELGIDADRPGIAVALNGRVVWRAAWQTTALGQGDRIEIVQACGGG